MKAKFVLIGGGDVGRGNTNYETKEIDEKIVELTNKKNPIFLFIGLASSFSDSYYDTMKEIYRSIGCETVYLKKKNIINNPQIVEEKIKNADIIYFCGGDAIKLIDTIKEYNIDKLLLEKAKEEVVFAGMSAGAIMFCEKGYSDALILREENDKYSFVNGLGLLPISITPHYESNTDRIKELETDIKETTDIIIGIKNNSALIIEGNNYNEIGMPGNVKCYYKDNKFITREIKNSGELNALKEVD